VAEAEAVLETKVQVLEDLAVVDQAVHLQQGQADQVLLTPEAVEAQEEQYKVREDQVALV
jgi:hypothetical protein|tara:strand:- start:324 stop:503 length:180 start_codon:yes stop_codon:yes gene_type:complete